MASTRYHASYNVVEATLQAIHSTRSPGVSWIVGAGETITESAGADIGRWGVRREHSRARHGGCRARSSDAAMHALVERIFAA